METAIAVHEGEFNHNCNGKFAKVRILSCTDPNIEGLHFCVHNQWVELGRHYLVQFWPDDQFCRVIPLAEANSPIESVGSLS